MSRNFDANASNYISFGTNVIDIEDASAFTVLAFFRVEDTATDDRMIWNVGTGAAQGFGIRIDTGVAPQELESRQNGSSVFFTTASIELNTWYLSAITNDGANTATSLTLYLCGMNGTVIDSNTGSHDAPTGTTGDLTLGRFLSNTVDLFDGDIAYFAHFNFEMTQDQVLAYLANPVRIAAAYNANCSVFAPINGGSPEPDWSGNGISGTINGTLNVSDMPPISPILGRTPASFVTTAAAAHAGILVNQRPALKSKFGPALVGY